MGQKLTCFSAPEKEEKLSAKNAGANNGNILLNLLLDFHYNFLYNYKINIQIAEGKGVLPKDMGGRPILMEVTKKDE